MPIRSEQKKQRIYRTDGYMIQLTSSYTSRPFSPKVFCEIIPSICGGRAQSVSHSSFDWLNFQLAIVSRDERPTICNSTQWIVAVRRCHEPHIRRLANTIVSNFKVEFVLFWQRSPQILVIQFVQNSHTTNEDNENGIRMNWENERAAAPIESIKSFVAWCVTLFICNDRLMTLCVFDFFFEFLFSFRCDWRRRNANIRPHVCEHCSCDWSRIDSVKS